MKLKLLIVVFFVGTTLNLTAQIGVDWGRVNTISLSGAYGGVFAQSLDTVYVAKKGKIYKSTDATATWSIYETGVLENFYDIIFTDFNTGYAVGNNGSLLKTIDAGDNWSLLTLNTSADLYEIEATPNGTLWIVGEGGIIIKSTDGISWVEDTTVTTEHLASVAFRNDTEGFIGGTNGTILHTTDGGQSWLPVSTSPDYDIFNIEVSDTYFYAARGQFGEESYSSGYIVSKNASGFIKSSDLISWEEAYVESTTFSDMKFYNDVGYSIGGGVMLCSCCSLGFRMYTPTNAYWYSTGGTSNINWSNCNFNSSYFKMSLYQNQIGYAVSGAKLYQTPSDYALAVPENESSDITVYPNPATDGYIQINSESVELGSLSFLLYDVNGKLVKEFSDAGNGRLNVKDIAKGIYFLVAGENGITLGTQKIIIE